MKRKFSMFLNIAMLAICVCAIAFGVYSAKTANLNVAGTIGFKANNCDVDITASIYGHANGDDPLGTPVLKEDAEPLNGGSVLQITGADKALGFGIRYFSDLGESGEVEPIYIELTITNKSQFEVLLEDLTTVAEGSKYTAVCTNPLHVLYTDEDKTTTLQYVLRPAKVDGEYQEISSPVDISLSMKFSKIDTSFVGKESDGWLIDEESCLYEVPEADSSGLLVIPTQVETSEGIKDVVSLYLGTDEGYNRLEGYTKVVVSRSVTSLLDSFWDCTSLTAIAIPNSVTEIHDNTFYGCTSLTSITIPKSVTNIVGLRLDKLGSSTILVVDSDNPKYDSRNNCNAIIETDTNTLVAGYRNTVIPSSVTSIGERAFSDCSSLTSITIPSSVNSIGNSAFHNCFSLFEVCNLSTSLTITAGSTDNGRVAYYAKAVITNPSNSKLTTINDYVIYNESETSKILVKYLGTNTSIELPSTVTSIHDYAFYNNRNLTNVTIPSSVNRIGNDAFSGCSSLTEMTILRTIPPALGTYAISSATTKIYIPAGTLSAYQSADKWSSYADKFVEMSA